jgi:hypothetical protein
MAETLLANPVIEYYAVHAADPAPATPTTAEVDT